MWERWELEGSLWPWDGYFSLQYAVQGLLSRHCSVTDCHLYTWQVWNLKASNGGILDMSSSTGSAFVSHVSFQKTSRLHPIHFCLDTVSRHTIHILRFCSMVFRNKQCPWLVHWSLFWKFYFTILVYFCFETFLINFHLKHVFLGDLWLYAVFYNAYRDTSWFCYTLKNDIEWGIFRWGKRHRLFVSHETLKIWGVIIKIWNHWWSAFISTVPISGSFYWDKLPRCLSINQMCFPDLFT